MGKNVLKYTIKSRAKMLFKRKSFFDRYILSYHFESRSKQLIRRKTVFQNMLGYFSFIMMHLISSFHCINVRIKYLVTLLSPMLEWTNLNWKIWNFHKKNMLVTIEHIIIGLQENEAYSTIWIWNLLQQPSKNSLQHPSFTTQKKIILLYLMVSTIYPTYYLITLLVKILIMNNLILNIVLVSHTYNLIPDGLHVSKKF